MLGTMSCWTQEKFTTLSLGFKTDRQTLDQRLEVHLRARDVAENNIRKELAAVRDGLRVCDTECWVVVSTTSAAVGLSRGQVKVKVNVDLYSALSWRRSDMARVLKGSRSFTCTPRAHPLTEWTIPAFAFPAKAGTHLPTPEGWKAELALGGWLVTEQWSRVTSTTWLRGYFAGIRFCSLELKIRKKNVFG